MPNNRSYWLAVAGLVTVLVLGGLLAASVG